MFEQFGLPNLAKLYVNTTSSLLHQTRKPAAPQHAKVYNILTPEPTYTFRLRDVRAGSTTALDRVSGF